MEFKKVIKLAMLLGTLGMASSVFAQKQSIKALTTESSQTQKIETAPPVEQPRELPYQQAPTVSTPIQLHSLGLGVGQTFLKGQFQDNGEDKITFDLYYSYAASYSFDLLVNAHHSKHGFKSREATISGTSVGIKSKIYNFDNFAPYFHGGVGFYRPKITRPVADAMVESEGKVTFGLNFGAGAELRLNDKFLVGLIGHYHDPFDVKQEIGPKVEGSYFKLLLMGMYSFRL